MKKYFVEKGLYAGETVIITSEEAGHVIAQPIDDHGRDSGELISVPREYLIELN